MSLRAIASPLLVVMTFASAAAVEAAPRVLMCPVEGSIDAGSADYLQACVREAENRRADALLVVLDTPGGALESTRQIVSAFLRSEVPVLVWVGPPGARAGSAGVFVTLASHVAGMAPATNIGAAAPVMGPTGADPEQAGGETMAEKVKNDTVAFARSLAELRGRNAEWAASAVAESASISANEALEKKVIEVIAPTPEAFLDQVSGRSVKLDEDRTVTLNTREATLEELRPTLRQNVLHWLANPSLAYLLFLVGILGIAMELSNPGLIVPGVVGVICFLLALVAMSALPIQTGAVALLVVGVGLIVAEFFVTSGLLAVAGIILLGLGGVLLVDRFDPDWFVEPSYRVPLRVLLPTTAVLGGMAAFVVWRAAQGRKRPQLGGDIGMLGEAGRALTAIDHEGGQVFVHGEIWSARADKPIAENAHVRVVQVDGLTVRVEEVPG